MNVNTMVRWVHDSKLLWLFRLVTDYLKQRAWPDASGRWVSLSMR